MMLRSDDMLDALRAAGEPTRLRILVLLAAEELSVMELGRILDQSQPRVSRHLKLMSEAGLIERFPDGAWVFYRLPSAGSRRALVDAILDRLDLTEDQSERDLARLAEIQAERLASAAAYFEQVAPRWDDIRSHYVAEDAVEAAIVRVAGEGPFRRLIDLGTGSGRMLTLLGTRARSALGLDLSQQMLNVARARAREAGLDSIELRHGDIFSTREPDASADLVLVHQVLHYLNDPASAVAEAARLTAPGGRLLLVDFAPHALEQLREQHQHRRLGFSDEEISRWLADAGLSLEQNVALPPSREPGLTVKIWAAVRSRDHLRSVA
ncbi:MAG: ArsR/SmtB family transcription factor [Asticcacaulis sp.]